jgi:DNA polymerase-1
VKQLAEAMRIPLFEKQGFEADDVLATLARSGRDAGHEIWIYSGDKDFIPLIEPGISLRRPAGRQGAEDEILDERSVKQKFGIRPPQFRDVLALMGDKADNVPGVPGVGEKTAIKLIATFRSLERLFDHLEDKRISPRQRGLLREHHEEALLSQRLVTIDQRVPLDFDWESFTPVAPWTEELRALCRELEFEQVLSRLDHKLPGPAPRNGRTVLDYRVIESVASLRERLAELPRDVAWAIDTETTDRDPMRAELVGISISAREGQAHYVPVEVRESVRSAAGLFSEAPSPALPWKDVRPQLAAYFEDPRIAKVGQNLKYDQIVLERHGVSMRGVEFDTMIASYLLAPERRQHNLDALAEEELGVRTIPYRALFEGLDGRDIRDVPLDRIAHYACEDADVTRRLYEIFRPRLIELELDHLLHDVEIPLSEILKRMEMRGIRLNVPLLEQLRLQWQRELDALTRQIHDLAGGAFNLNSPKQLQEVLFERLGLKPRKKTATGWSTDVGVLNELAREHPLPAHLLEYRQLAKLLSTYVEALPRLVNPETGRIHTSYNQAVAATGRLSSTDPNLQNIPIRTEMGRRIREAFIPRDEGWCLLAGDYSQIELLLMAHMSTDDTLCDAFRRGADIHARTAAIVNGLELEQVDAEMRRKAKAINFGILYGMGARALAQQIGVGTKEAQTFIDEYFSRLPRVRLFIDETVRKATESGEVRTILGRRRRLPELASSDPRQRSFGERIAVNTPIQGSAADLIKVAMIHLEQRIEAEKLPARLLLQVHDELILEVAEEASAELATVVREEMERVGQLEVPLIVDVHVGRNWAEAHP